MGEVYLAQDTIAAIQIVSAQNATHNRAIRRDVKRDNVMMRKPRFNVDVCIFRTTDLPDLR